MITKKFRIIGFCRIGRDAVHGLACSSDDDGDDAAAPAPAPAQAPARPRRKLRLQRLPPPLLRNRRRKKRRWSATSRVPSRVLSCGDGDHPTEFSEAPTLAAMVAAGTLPPVEERLPNAEDVMVVPVVDRIGDYGGTWRKGFHWPERRSERRPTDDGHGVVL